MDKKKKLIIMIVVIAIVLAAYYFYTKGKSANAATLPASQDAKKLSLVNASAADDVPAFVWSSPAPAMSSIVNTGVSVISNPKFNIIQKLKNLF